MTLSTQSINEIRSLVSQRNSSPRGVADTRFFEGNSDDSSAKATPENINACATRFVQDVLKKAVTMTEYCYRMTTVPADVAAALDLIGREALENNQHRISADVDEMKDEEEGDDEAVMGEVEQQSKKQNEVKVEDIERVRAGMIKFQANARGASVRDQMRDHTLAYDSDSSDDDSDLDDDETPYIDRTRYNVQNTSTPEFDEAYPPLSHHIGLSDEEFKEQIFESRERNNGVTISSNVYRGLILLGDGVPCAAGHVSCDCDDRSEEQSLVIVGMLKRATYAYLVAKLS